MYFNFTNPWMWALLVILIIENLNYYITTPGAFLSLVLSIPAVLIAITFHEYAHALAADKLGDDTPRNQGRLTLNPLAHIDPYGIILMLTAGFGWGKPVEINSNNFTRKVSVRQGNAIVSIAGPCMNFVLAIIFSIIYGLMLKFANNFILTTTGNVIATMIEYTITMNVGLGVFNLIPLPPLDGSKVILAFLPFNAREWYERNEKMLYIIFIIIWITPISSMIISPMISWIDTGLIKLITTIAR